MKNLKLSMEIKLSEFINLEDSASFNSILLLADSMKLKVNLFLLIQSNNLRFINLVTIHVPKQHPDSIRVN